MEDVEDLSKKEARTTNQGNQSCNSTWDKGRKKRKTKHFLKGGKTIPKPIISNNLVIRVNISEVLKQGGRYADWPISTNEGIN